MKFEIGMKVQTRDGRPARIICIDRVSENYPIIVAITEKDGSELIAPYTKEGLYHLNDYDNQYNLMPIDKKEDK